MGQVINSADHLGRQQTGCEGAAVEGGQSRLGVDFTALSVAELDDFVVANQADLNCEGIEPGDVLKVVNAGRAVIETRPFGFAVVRLKAAADGQQMPHLWILFVNSERRGSGIGRRFVRDLLRIHSRHYCMTLKCHGPRRRRFFGRLGFRVEGCDGEWRSMTTSDWIYGMPARR